MSGSGGGGKLNPKNLHYDRSATLPPFLARLHAQHAPGNFDGPDPILAARRRPTKKRSGSEEAEDAPLILDEEGNVVGEKWTVGKDGTVSEKPGAEGEGEIGEDKEKDGSEGVTGEGKTKEEEKQEKNVGIGASKKRKVGKVIRGDADSDQEEVAPNTKKRKGSDQGNKATAAKDDNDEEPGEKPKPKTNKKKAKKIKLSFGDEEG